MSQKLPFLEQRIRELEAHIKNVENEIKKVLEEIQSGSFFSEWQSEHNDDYPNLTQLREEEKEISIKEVSKYMLKELFGDKLSMD